MEHYRNPRNFGELKNYSVKHEEHNTFCGDRVEMYLQIEKGKIKDVKWRGEGCAICMAGVSMLSEEIKLIKLIELIKRLSSEGVLRKLGMEEINIARRKCALLGWECLRHCMGKFM